MHLFCMSTRDTLTSHPRMERTRRQRPPVQALLQVEGPASRDVGEGQGGDEEGEAEVARGRPTGG